MSKEMMLCLMELEKAVHHELHETTDSGLYRQQLIRLRKKKSTEVSEKR